MRNLAKIIGLGSIILAGALYAGCSRNDPQISNNLETSFEVPEQSTVFLEDKVEPLSFPLYPSIDNNSVLQPWRDLIVEKSEKYGFDPDFVGRMIWQESKGDPTAVSPDGAVSWVQLMPSNIERYEVSNILDREETLEAGLKHLRWLTDKFGGDLEQGLAAYNTGQVRVRRALKKGSGRTQKTINRVENGNDVWEYPTYSYHGYDLRTERLDSETQGYLVAIMGEPGK